MYVSSYYVSFEQHLVNKATYNYVSELSIGGIKLPRVLYIVIKIK